MVIHRIRIAATSMERKIRSAQPGSFDCSALGLAKSATPRSGMKMTATSHDANTAMLTTAKIENVYSPAALLAKPIGTNPAMVTKEPVSIGNAKVL